MFGSLLGTLQKFCQEESRLKPKEEKKAQIEKKLEEQEIQERANLRKEKQNLFSNRKRQQLEIKILEVKMMRLEELKEWEESVKPLRNFIRTVSKPYIYFRPKVIDKKTQQKIDENEIEIDKMIEKKRIEVSEELKNVEMQLRNASHDYDGEVVKEVHDSSRHDNYVHDVEQETQFSDIERRIVNHKTDPNNRVMSGIIVKIERDPMPTNTIQSVVATPTHNEKNSNPIIKSEIIKSSKSVSSRNEDELI